MGKTVETGEGCGGFGVIASDGRRGIVSGSVGVHVVFCKAILVPPGGNKDFEVGMCAKANIFVAFQTRMREDGVSSATQMRQRNLLRLR